MEYGRVVDLYFSRGGLGGLEEYDLDIYFLICKNLII